MVVGGCGIVGYSDKLEIRICIEQVRYPQQIAPNRANVGQRQALTFPHGLLQGDVPLIRPGQLEMRIGYNHGANGWIGSESRRSSVLRGERKRCQHKTSAGTVGKEGRRASQ